MLGFERITPGVRLIVVLVVAGWFFRAGLGDWLSASPDGMARGHLWRLVTYPFASGLSLGSMLSLICFVPFACSVETSLGTVRFRRLFWSSTLLAGALIGLLGLFSRPLSMAGLWVPFLAVSTAFSLLNWRRTVYFFWLLPLPARFLLPLNAVSLALAPASAWPALLSPMALAYAMIRRNWLMQAEVFRRPVTRKRSRLSDTVVATKVSPIRPQLNQPSVSETEVQVNRILDKLRSEGMASLSPLERSLLESQSKRLRHGDERM